MKTYLELFEEYADNVSLLEADSRKDVRVNEHDALPDMQAQASIELKWSTLFAIANSAVRRFQHNLNNVVLPELLVLERRRAQDTQEKLNAQDFVARAKMHESYKEAMVQLLELQEFADRLEAIKWSMVAKKEMLPSIHSRNKHELGNIPTENRERPSHFVMTEEQPEWVRVSSSREMSDEELKENYLVLRDRSKSVPF